MGTGVRHSGIGNRESGIGNRESGIEEPTLAWCTSAVALRHSPFPALRVRRDQAPDSVQAH
ncbi:hypothetical protein D0A36_10360 [Xanthomonas campestris]|nr:hypothetical protein D0A36_10360 [Xanthomonas campestris]